MKFIYTVNGMVEEKGNIFTDATDWFAGKSAEAVLIPIGNFFADFATTLWDWFLYVLPDLMGYGAILAAVGIILGAMIGKGGMMKPLSIYAGVLIVVVVILGGVR